MQSAGERYSGLRVVDKTEDGKYRAVKNGANLNVAKHLNVVLISPALLTDEEKTRFDEAVKTNVGKSNLKLGDCPISPPFACKGGNQLGDQQDRVDALAPSPKKRKSISN